MTKKLKLQVGLLVLISMVFYGCQNNLDSLNSQRTEVSVKMKAEFTQPSGTSNSRSKENHVTFAQALVGLSEIEFEMFDEDCHYEDSDNSESDDNESDHSHEVEFEGAFVVDLLTGTIDPDPGIEEIAPGIYEEIELTFSPVLENGNSIYLLFELEDDQGMSTTIEVASDKRFEIELENKDGEGFLVNELTLNEFIVRLDLTDLISSIDVGMLYADTDGIVRINHDSNEEVLKQIIDYLRGSFSAERSDDSNSDENSEHSDDEGNESDDDDSEDEGEDEGEEDDSDDNDAAEDDDPDSNDDEEDDDEEDDNSNGNGN